MLQQGILAVDDTMSNLTSVTSNEASISSRNKVADHDNHPSANLHQSHHQQNNHDLHFASPSNDLALQPPPANKKKRSLPGNPDPEAEVVALSPKSLMATNRFLCEICNKGFQRDQNLQLHRRGHNLPWKLKQRSKTEVVKKKVYICPEPSCVHHEPSRALGDLTGIKKHFSRKHGEKKFKCEKCSKRYAVHSDWKAHSKICGTREYRCDCGTLFSRRDSFITHRAFCDALAEESSRSMTQQQNPLFAAAQNQNMKPHQPYHQILFHDNTQKQEITTHNNFNHLLPPWLSTSDPVVAAPPNQRNNPLLLSSCSQKLQHQPFAQENPNNNNIINTGNNMIFSTTPTTPSLMSATALLRKAAQMGVTTMNANNTLNRSSGVIDQSSSPAYHHHVGRFISSSTAPSSNNITAGGLSSSSREAFLHGLASLGNEVVGGCMMQLHHQDANVDDVSCVVGNNSLPSSVFEDGFDGILNPKGNGNNNEGLTRDFLGLRAFPNDHRDFINVVNLDQIGSSSSSFDHHLQSSTQDQAPWQS